MFVKDIFLSDLNVWATVVYDVINKYEREGAVPRIELKGITNAPDEVWDYVESHLNPNDWLYTRLLDNNERCLPFESLPEYIADEILEILNGKATDEL